MLEVEKGVSQRATTRRWCGMTAPALAPCVLCGSSELLSIDTYKRVWQLCTTCGCGVPRQKDKYPLSFLPWAAFRKQSQATEKSMYDYFVSPVHVEYSIRTGREFLQDTIDPNGIDLAGRVVLDVSGGNGHFLKVLTERGAAGVLTEINERAIEYARKQHGFESFQFDFNRDRLSDLTTRTFDLMLLRAAIMFCSDLPAFVRDARERLRPGGLVIVDDSVKPTLGVLCRVQIDEFSYRVLRQPETVIRDFVASGFELVHRRDETDPTDYVYDHDLQDSWMFLHYLYEIRGARALRSQRPFNFAARDRRRSTMIFRKV